MLVPIISRSQTGMIKAARCSALESFHKPRSGLLSPHKFASRSVSRILRKNLYMFMRGRPENVRKWLSEPGICSRFPRCFNQTNASCNHFHPVSGALQVLNLAMCQCPMSGNPLFYVMESPEALLSYKACQCPVSGSTLFCPTLLKPSVYAGCRLCFCAYSSKYSDN